MVRQLAERPYFRVGYNLHVDQWTMDRSAVDQELLMNAFLWDVR